MIDRNSPEYQEAKWRVKIGHAFLEKGIDIKGVVHVGANNGYEIQYYFQLGIEKVAAFEPLPLAIDLLINKYKDEIKDEKLLFFPIALGSKKEKKFLNVAPDDGQGSSFLMPTETYQKEHPEYDYKKFPPIEVEVERFDKLVLKKLINPRDYDCLVVDTQGTELEVLKGFGGYLKYFKCLNIECSKDPVYEGGAAAQEIVDYLAKLGFKQDSPIEDHNDIFFIK